MREFLRGAAELARGFGWWRRHPRLMTLGLLPALIVAAVLVTGLVVLGVNLDAVVAALTPFADDWPEIGASIVRLAVGAGIFVGAVVLAAVSFTALTLVVGEPFYDRIWRAAETDLGGSTPDADYGLWRAAVDALGLFLRGAGVAVLAALLGFVPIVGGALGLVTGLVLTGWLLADELTSRALTARGLGGAARRRLRRGRRLRMLGFGVATQACFLVPLGAIVTMPAAVAGSTALAHRLLADATELPVTPRD